MSFMQSPNPTRAGLHIVVCVKVVPKPEEVTVDPQTWRLERTNVRSEINPPDMNAMEMALRIKDQYAARVDILSMGPPFFAPLLRVALAMGGDHIYLLSDRAFGGADTLATSYTLAKAVEKLGDVDLVICGEESSDGSTGQVPAGMAEWLDWPQITALRDLNVDMEHRRVRGRREIQDGYAVLATSLPALVSVQTAANEPRFMDYECKAWAFAPEQCTIWSLADLGAAAEFVGVSGSPTEVAGLAQAPARARQGIFLTGPADDVAIPLANVIVDAL